MNKSMDDKSSQSLEDKFDDLASLQKSPKTLSKKQEIKQQIEGKVVYQKISPGAKSKSLDRKADIHLDAQAKSKSLDRNYVTPASMLPENEKHFKQEVVKVDVHPTVDEEPEVLPKEPEIKETKEVSPSNSYKEKTEDDSSMEWMTSSQHTIIENDTQTVIMERRKIDIYNKQRQNELQESKSNQDIHELLTHERRPEVTRVTSEEESLTEVSDLKVSDESHMLGICLPYIDADSSSDQDQKKPRIPRGKSDDSGSWVTVDYEETTLDTELPLSDGSSKTRSKRTLDPQGTFDESSASLMEFLKHESMSQVMSDSETERGSKVSREPPKSIDLSLKWKNKNKIIVTPPQENSPTIENIPFIDSSTSKSNKSEGEHTGSSGSDKSPTEPKPDQRTLLTAKSRRNELLKLSAERSRSSESTSWTSIEKDVSPSSHIKGSSIDDESSVSCSIARPLGISQDIEKLNKKDRECLEELKQAMEYGEEHLLSQHTISSDHSKSNSKSPSPIPELTRIESPRSPSKYGTRKSPTPTLEKQGQVDSQKAPSDSDSSSESIDKTVEQLSRPNVKKSGLDKIGKAVIEESESSQSAASKTSDAAKELQNTVKKTKIAITISQEDQNTTIDFDDDGNVITSSFERDLMKKRALKDHDQKSSSKSSVDTTTTTTTSKGSLSVDDSSSRRKGRLLDDQKSSSKSSMDSRGSLSVESRGSFETTESTSGSLGEAYRRGEELKPTWRPFFGASGSENSTSIEEAWIPQDHEGYESLAASKDAFEYNNQRLLDDFQTFSKNPPLSANTSKDSTDADFTDDLNDFPVNFLYPATSSSGSNTSDVVIGYGQTFGRTLSRISERSTASEKTSADEDSTKACSRSESINEESLNSSDHQASLSSDPPSNANVAYISDTDRRTSAEMPDIPIDQTKISEMYESKRDVEKASKAFDALESKRSNGSPSRPGIHTPKTPSKQSSASESQESDDWPLPELPPQAGTRPSHLEEIGRKESSDFDQWPSLPSSLLETPIIEKVHIYYMSNEPEQPTKVVLQSESSKDQLAGSDDDSDTLNNDDDLEKDVPESKSEKSNELSEDSPKGAKVIPYDQSGYMVEPLEKHDEYTCHKNVVPNYDKSCLSGTISKATCLMGDVGSCCSRAEHKSFSVKNNLEDKVIISQPQKSPTNHSPIFEDDHLYADDVFGGDSKSLSPDFDKGFSQLGTQKYSFGSNNSDTSIDDLLSQTNAEDTVRAVAKLSTGSAGTCKRCSHSSHSEEETSSFGTDLDGTVKIGLPQKKCTHSSHSEDTSICLSISEWSTGTNTVRQYANLSASESISGVSVPKSDKSDKASKVYSSSHGSKKSDQKPKMSSQAEMSSKSSSLDKSSENIKYDKLCSSETTISRKGMDSSSGTKSDSTLTLAQSISDWSASTSHTLIATAREDQLEADNTKSDDTIVKDPINNDEKTDTEIVITTVTSPTKEIEEAKEPVLRLTASYTGKTDKSSSISYSDKSDKSSSSSLSSLQKHANGVFRFDQRLEGFPPLNDETHERYPKVPPKSLSYEEQTHRYSKPTMRCQSEDSGFKPYFVSEQPELDIDMPSQLYSQEEKHSERYQSQEFSNIIREEGTSSKFIRSDYKPLAKHASYDDKTLSKNQIKEYKTSQQYRSKPKSWSFHEHYLASSDLPMISVPEIPSVHRELSEKRSAERSGKTPLSRCSPYYSSSLSSESPPIQPLKAPVKKSLLVRNISLKSPPSGNDTDSSLDVIRDPRERMKTFRRKKQVTSARKRQERIQDVLEEDSTKSQYSSESDMLGGKYLAVEESLRRMESSECSDSYLPEVESGSSEMSKGDSKHYDIQEASYSEDEGQDEYAKYKSANYEAQQFPINIAPMQFQGFGSSADEDEMGFPRFDRLGRLRHPYLDSQEPPYVSEDSPPRVSYSNKSSRQSSLKKSKSTSSYRQPEDQSMGEPSGQHQQIVFYDEQSDRDDSDDYAYPIDTIKRAPKMPKSGSYLFERGESVAYSDTELPHDKDEYEEYRGSPYPEHYEEVVMFQTQECYPQYEHDMNESRDVNQEQYTRDLDQRFSLNNVERFYSSHYVDSQASSDSPEQKFDVSTLPPPLCSDDEND
ncbi:unnamed protein product [Chrysodeixis includens]|uniref:Uncharacterized protein n=1 Tax=Chrysodeixis includens TaxID=689277 RepID=A0A9P0C138_CHRIL|nr:unnamed protein product [Chrysodeixis includens]